MANTARRIDYYGSAAPVRTPQRSTQRRTRPDIKVVPGRKVEVATLPPVLVNAFKFALAIVMVMIAVCAVRVWLSAATVQSLQNVESLQGSIEQAYAAGDELEIEHSVLASPSRIQAKAKALGMGSPEQRTYIEVSLPAQIATNAYGTASISGTVKNIEDASKAKHGK